MQTGIHPAIGRQQYDRLDRVNWSSLKRIGRSPLHYRHALNQEGADTDALKLGHAVHVAVLEAELFASLYAVWEGGRRAGPAWQDFVERHADREILTAAEYDQCIAIQSAVQRHPIAGGLFRGGQAEVTITWENRIPAAGDLPEIVTPCKGRVDYLRSDMILDLKTTRDGSIDGFGREAWNLRYHTQAAFYRDGIAASTGRVLPFKLVVVEKEPPYAVTIFGVPEYLLEIGRQEYTALLSHLEWCRTENHWPGYADEEVDLVLPHWAVPRRNDDDDIAGMDLVIGGD